MMAVQSGLLSSDFFVPAKWRNYTHTGQHEYNDWADYDFSILELSENLGRTRHFIPPGLSGMFCNNQKSLHGVGSDVDYVSFPDDKSKDARSSCDSKT